MRKTYGVIAAAALVAAAGTVATVGSSQAETRAFGGTHIVTATMTTKHADFAKATALCPSGETVVTGGVSSNTTAGVFVMASAPTADGNGWFGSTQNSYGNAKSYTLTVYAVCAPAGN
jgi:DhnA family fructose-bisphosphate aldolase class Ia